MSSGSPQDFAILWHDAAHRLHISAQRRIVSSPSAMLEQLCSQARQTSAQTLQTRTCGSDPDGHKRRARLTDLSTVVQQANVLRISMLAPLVRQWRAVSTQML